MARQLKPTQAQQQPATDTPKSASTRCFSRPQSGPKGIKFSRSAVSPRPACFRAYHRQTQEGWLGFNVSQLGSPMSSVASHLRYPAQFEETCGVNSRSHVRVRSDECGNRNQNQDTIPSLLCVHEIVHDTTAVEDQVSSRFTTAHTKSKSYCTSKHAVSGTQSLQSCRKW